MLVAASTSRVLRIWEPEQSMVVLGRSSPAQAEVNLEACRHENVWVGRRVSGGQTIVTGLGCLMYGVVIDYHSRPELRMLDRAHEYVMTRMKEAIASLGISVEINGVSDLTFEGKKFSGNSMRCVKDRFLYHGTMICQDFDLSCVTKYLKRPVREPEYRAGRSHEDFLTRLPVTCKSLRQAIINQWGAKEVLPPDQVDSLLRDAEQLAVSKYGAAEWTLKVP